MRPELYISHIVKKTPWSLVLGALNPFLTPCAEPAEGPGGGGVPAECFPLKLMLNRRVSTLAVPRWREAVRVPGEAGAELACARDAPCSLVSLL